MLRYETFNSGFSLKKYTFNPATVHSACSFASLHSEIPRFLVWAAQGFSEVRGSLCSHVVFVMSPLFPPPPPGHSHLWDFLCRCWCRHQASGHVVVSFFALASCPFRLCRHQSSSLVTNQLQNLFPVSTRFVYNVKVSGFLPL